MLRLVGLAIRIWASRPITDSALHRLWDRDSYMDTRGMDIVLRASASLEVYAKGDFSGGHVETMLSVSAKLAPASKEDGPPFVWTGVEFLQRTPAPPGQN